jgi:hypothetical protein
MKMPPGKAVRASLYKGQAAIRVILHLTWPSPNSLLTSQLHLNLPFSPWSQAHCSFSFFTPRNFPSTCLLQVSLILCFVRVHSVTECGLHKEREFELCCSFLCPSSHSTPWWVVGSQLRFLNGCCFPLLDGQFLQGRIKPHPCLSSWSPALRSNKWKKGCFQVSQSASAQNHFRSQTGP